MLVLSRKSGERIHIGDEITLEVRRIAGNRVTLALRAPRNVRILRGELEKVAKEFDDSSGKSPKGEGANGSAGRHSDSPAESGDAQAGAPLIVMQQPPASIQAS